MVMSFESGSVDIIYYLYRGWLDTGTRLFPSHGKYMCAESRVSSAVLNRPVRSAEMGRSLTAEREGKWLLMELKVSWGDHVSIYNECSILGVIQYMLTV